MNQHHEQGGRHCSRGALFRQRDPQGRSRAPSGDPVGEPEPRALRGAAQAWARAQIRFVVGVDPAAVLPALRRHLDRHGFPMVEIAQARDEIFYASLLDPEHPWMQWTVASMTATSRRRPAVQPSAGGSVPNDVFSELHRTANRVGAAFLSRLLPSVPPTSSWRKDAGCRGTAGAICAQIRGT
jgi:hypothetical protein